MLRGDTIENFYNKKQILITGGTGFVGMALVEKLLRSFPQIDKIYLLIRGNKSGSAASRSDNYFENKLFSRVREVNPTFISKIEWLEGHLCATNLGLSDEVIGKLKKSLDIIVHSGATINMQENLFPSIKVNLGGTKNVLDLAESCENIKCFLHVSTASVNNKETTNELLEIIYPHPVNPEVLLKLLKSPETTVNMSENTYLVGWHNAYTYTKNAAENLVHKYRNLLPIGIFRPAFVSHSYAEPYPYWMHETNVFPLQLDILAKMCGDENSAEVQCNMVPVDLTVNGLLATIVNVGINRSLDEIQIYNYTTSNNSCMFSDLMKFYNRDDKKLSFGRPKLNAKLFSNTALGAINIPRFVKFVKWAKQKFIVKFYYDNSNIDELWDSLDEKGKELLPFNIRDVVWEKYFTELNEKINENSD